MKQQLLGSLLSFALMTGIFSTQIPVYAAGEEEPSDETTEVTEISEASDETEQQNEEASETTEQQEEETSEEVVVLQNEEKEDENSEQVSEETAEDAGALLGDLVPSTIGINTFRYTNDAKSEAAFDIMHNGSGECISFLNAIGLSDISKSGSFSPTGITIKAGSTGLKVKQTAYNYAKDSKVTILFDTTSLTDKNQNIDITVTVSGYDPVTGMLSPSDIKPVPEPEPDTDPQPSPSGNSNVPFGTKIDGVTKQDGSLDAFVISCPESDNACSAYIKAVESSGTFYLNDHTHDDTACTWKTKMAPRIPGRIAIGITPEDFPNTDGWNIHSIAGVVVVPGYKRVRQGSESNSYDPITGACTLKLVDDSTILYEITCNNDDFKILDTNTSVTLGLSNNSGGVNVPLGSEYTVTDGNRKLSFNRDNLERSGAVINPGPYDVMMIIGRVNDKSFPGMRYNVTTDGQVMFPPVNNTPNPNGLFVKAVEKEDATALQISCDKGDACTAYLDKMYSESKKGFVPGGTNFLDKNSGFLLYTDYRPYPFPINENVFTQIQENGKTIALEVSTNNIINELGIESGTTFVRGEVKVAGYRKTDLSKFPITITRGAVIVDDVVLSQNENYELVATTSNKEFLEQVNQFGITSAQGTSGGDKVTAEWKKIEDLGNGKYRMTISLKDLHKTYAWVGQGEKTIKLTGGRTYSSTKFNLVHPFKQMPSDVRISVVGNGLRISNTSTPNPVFLKEVGEGKDIPVLEEFNTRINFLNSNGDTALYVPRSAFDYNYNSGSAYVEVPITWPQLKELGASETAPYRFSFIDTIYGGSGPQQFVLPLNPILLTYYAVNANAGSTGAAYSSAELENLDKLAITTEDSGLKNVTVTEAADSVNEANVAVIGEVAGAVTTNNNGGADNSDLNYDNPNVVISVRTNAVNVTDTQAQAVLSKFSGSSPLTLTPVHFDISIQKTYNKESGKEGTVNVKELPYAAALLFDLPSDSLPEGKEYHFLREHDGVVEEIKFEIVVIDGKRKGLAYSNKFSSFVLAVGDVKKEESKSDDSKPAPVDNVVTCQMAGYPAGYAWNESAKACQLGFLDDAGLFHATSVRRAVPKTYDEGIQKHLFSLAGSIIVGLIAAYLLKATD